MQNAESDFQWIYVKHLVPKEWSIKGHYTAVHVKDAKAKETCRQAQMEERPSAERKVANS